MKIQNINWKKLLIPIVILGGIFMVFKGMYGRPHASAEDFRTAETNLAKYIVLRYEGVEKIEFQGWGYSPETGDWGTTLVINDTMKISYSLGELNQIETLGGSSYDSNEIFKLEREQWIEWDKIPEEISKISLDSVTVIYSHEGEEEEIFGF